MSHQQFDLFVDDATGDNGDNGTTLALAKATIAGALSVASPGMTIYIGPGTYSETLTLSTAGLTLVGASAVDTIISSATTPITVDDDTTLNNLRILGSGTVAAVIGFAKNRLTVDGCHIEGGNDAVVFSTTTTDSHSQLTIRNSRLEASFDALATIGINGILLENSEFYTDSTQAPTNSNAIKIGTTTGIHTTARIVNCYALAERGSEYDGDDSAVSYGLNVGSATADSATVYAEGCTFEAVATSATDTGTLYGALAGATSTGKVVLTLKGCNVNTSAEASTATVYDLITSGSPAKINAESTTFDSDKASGAVSIWPVGVQQRVNTPPTFRLKISTRDDGTHAATKPVRLRSGGVTDITVGVDVQPLFGDGNRVASVGTPTVSGGSITAQVAGPRDEPNKQYAVVVLGGTATASEERTIDVPVTMTSGEVVSVQFSVEVFAS